VRVEELSGKDDAGSVAEGNQNSTLGEINSRHVHIVPRLRPRSITENVVPVCPVRHAEQFAFCSERAYAGSSLTTHLSVAP